MTAVETLQHASGTASAPGDLPMPALTRREAVKAEQFRHDNDVTPRWPSDSDPVRVRATSGVGLALRNVVVRYTTDGSSPDSNSATAPTGHAGVQWTLEAGYLDTWEATIPRQPIGTVVRYQIVGTTEEPVAEQRLAIDGSGFWYQYGERGLTTFAYRVGAPSRLPDWMADAVVYHVFVDRFRNDEGEVSSNGDPSSRYGGTLAGIIDALPHLEQLGINTLWVSPIGPSPSYHRYDQTSFLDVDADLGGVDACRALVDEAHRAGIRVILDFVPSHVSADMPEFIAAQRDPEADSTSWFWFDEWPDRYRCFLGVARSLVSLNGQADGARDHLIDAAKFWVSDIGFDGLRLDHAIGLGSDFWAMFSSALETAKPDVALFGEVTDTAPALLRFDNQLQAILDFPLANAIRTRIGHGDGSARELGEFLRAHDGYMGSGPDRVTFIDNHDMNRFLFEAAGDRDRLRLGLLCLLTLPHTPVLYYGTEIGLSQTADKEAGGFGGDHVLRPAMPWDESRWDRELLEFTRNLIGARTHHEVLRRGTLEVGSSTETVLEYRLRLGDDRATVLLNLGDESVTLNAPGELVFATRPAKRIGNSIDLEPLSGALLLENGSDDR